MIPALPSNRRGHRKRISALRLSSDTTTTLPEYTNPPSAHWNSRHNTSHRPNEDDLPPEYPDSANEADDSCSDHDGYTQHVTAYTSLPSLQTSPRRLSRRHSSQQHRRQRSPQSSSDLYLDSLLERSIHALEMSNVLLQSSISTQTSVSGALKSNSPVDRSLEIRAQGLSHRITGDDNVHSSWLNELEAISQDVEGLFEEGSRSRRGNHRLSAHSQEGSLSSSLPTSTASSHLRRYRRRPSLNNVREESQVDVPALRLEPQARDRLIAPPPRALTQYIASTTDPDSIVLPSTIGLRSSSSAHSWKTAESSSASSPMSNTLSPSSSNLDKPPPSPAYNSLSTFAPKRSASPSTSTNSSRPASASHVSSTRQARSPISWVNISSEDLPHYPSRPSSRSRSVTPKQSAIHPNGQQIRCMTPPLEGSSPSPSSSSDECTTKQTIQSLRRILDVQPPPAPKPERPRAPAFLPRSPMPRADSAPSHATASVSRLFTKPTHTTSTRPRTPPQHSSLKRPSSIASVPTSGRGTPKPSLTTLSIPDHFGASVRALGGNSNPSSGRSTPKRLSFAELPRSYSSTKPEGSSSKMPKRRSKNKRNSTRSRKDSSSDDTGLGFWGNLFLNVGGGASIVAPPGGVRFSALERAEERRGASKGVFGAGMDDWGM